MSLRLILAATHFLIPAMTAAHQTESPPGNVVFE
jgi:hypothetical protein